MFLRILDYGVLDQAYTEYSTAVYWVELLHRNSTSNINFGYLLKHVNEILFILGDQLKKLENQTSTHVCN